MLNNSNSSGIKNTSANNHEKGFTVLEVIISMVVFLIVTGSVYGILVVAQRSRTTVSSQVQLTKSVRLALNIVGRDTFNAGFGYPLKDSVILRDNRISTVIGVPVDTNATPDTIPPVIAGNGITTNTFAVPNTNTDQVTFLFKDTTFNLTPAAGPANKQVSEPLSIKAGNITQSGGINQVQVEEKNTSCNVNDIFLITGSSSSTLAVVTARIDDDDDNKIQFGNTDVLGFNQNGGGTILMGITSAASMQRVKMITYYVTADGILTRREFANISTATTTTYWVDEPLVYGVDDFQIQYILADGTMTDNPSAGADNSAGTNDDVQTKLSTVRQIRFTVNAKTVDLNPAGQPYRVTMTSTFGTRNLGYTPN